MRIELRFGDLGRASLWTRRYIPNQDGVTSILTDVCDYLEKRGEFLVSGFGDSRWPLDIATDLAVFLEQLPVALIEIRKREYAEIDFYEQGVQRRVSFTPDSDMYVAECMSYGDWQPNPSTERIAQKELEAMLFNVREVFIHAFTEVAPNLVKHRLVARWLEGIDKY